MSVCGALPTILAQYRLTSAGSVARLSWRHTLSLTPPPPLSSSPPPLSSPPPPPPPSLSSHALFTAATRRVLLLQRNSSLTGAAASCYTGGGARRWLHVHCVRRSGGGWTGTVFESSPVLAVQQCLVQWHELAGVSWWAAIALATVLFRTVVTLPLSVYQHYFMAKFVNLKPQMDSLALEIRGEVARAQRKFRWSEKRAKTAFYRAIADQRSRLLEQHNCHPMKALTIALLQMPLWVSVSLALRNLVTGVPLESVSPHVVQLQLSAGGAMWFNNLLMPDPMFVLPVLFGVLNLCCLEIGYLSQLNKTPADNSRVCANRVSLYMMRTIFVCLVPLASMAPSALVFYWCCSSLHALLSHLLLLSPRLRRMLHIPATPSELAHPYRTLLRRQPPNTATMTAITTAPASTTAAPVARANSTGGPPSVARR